MSNPQQHTVTVPGARIAFFVQGDLATATPDAPPLVLIGSPMDHTGFTTLAGHFTDRPVVTYDPRNCGRSERDETTAPVSAEQHAADLHAVLADLGTGPVDLFASSGGAVNALALVAAHPDDLRTLVAHEPPAGGLLPDADGLAAACRQIVATYDDAGSGPAIARFIALVMHRGPITHDYLDQPGPDPAVFGLASTDDGTRDDPLMANLRGEGAGFRPDVDALRAATTRVVLAVAEESGGPEDGEVAGRSAYAVAAALGQQAVLFPGGHNGFLGGEFGQTGKPVEFAARLREVLAG